MGTYKLENTVKSNTFRQYIAGIMYNKYLKSFLLTACNQNYCNSDPETYFLMQT